MYDTLSLSDPARIEGNKGTYSFREQWLVLKTNSVYNPEKVFAWKIEKGKLHLNGTEFILKIIAK